MQAIILAAGTGNRLGQYADNKPKSMLEFNHLSLLKRHIRILMDNNIKEIICVVGYKSDLIKTHLKDSPVTIDFLTNDRYTEGSIISLGCARDIMINESEFLLMDADVLYHQQMITRLINTTIANCFLLDRDFIPGDEPVKLCIDKTGKIVEFGKQVANDPEFEIQGESIGFFKFNQTVGKLLAERIDDYIARDENNAPYEAAIRDLLLEYPDYFGYEDVTGLPWIEIDFPEDLTRAKQEILPGL